MGTCTERTTSLRDAARSLSSAGVRGSKLRVASRREVVGAASGREVLGISYRKDPRFVDLVKYQVKNVITESANSVKGHIQENSEKLELIYTVNTCGGIRECSN
ncbi:hypothetical protein [Nostoc sp.]|uniref:hypothetical protein n=1 Tax=Nostoc sp. TaxID=1180 RepID=UPI002FF9A5A4